MNERARDPCVVLSAALAQVWPENAKGGVRVRTRIGAQH